MGTTVSLVLPASQARGGVAAVRDLFAAWERTLSRFLPQSELSYLNRHAGLPVPVGELLFGVIEAALDAAQATGGLYDPTLLPQLVQLGYDRSFEAMPTTVPTTAYPPAPGGAWRSIRLDHARRGVTLPPGAGLDLGGIAKGMAVDAALERLRALGVEAAIVNAGGDLAVAGLPTGGDAWPIAAPLRHDHWVVPLRRGALATSSVARRHWRQGRQARHHLLDPRSGAPAQSGLWSVSVVAARCVQAEVAAKVAFVLGPREGARFIQDHGMAALLVQEDGQWQTAGPWPVRSERDRSASTSDTMTGSAGFQPAPRHHRGRLEAGAPSEIVRRPYLWPEDAP